jgi:hypothetical protein
MIRIFPDEKWEQLAFEEGALRYKYAVSNYGRIASYTNDIERGRILKGGLLGGYPTFVCRPFGKSKTFYIHKLVAEYFLEREDDEQTYVIHLDYNKANNHYKNLRWADKRKVELHQQKSPHVLKSRQERRSKKPNRGHKLTSTDVIRIKKKIFDPNRKTRMKIIAKQFGISEMQLYRIKSGENWSHIEVEEEKRKKSLTI